MYDASIKLRLYINSEYGLMQISLKAVTLQTRTYIKSGIFKIILHRSLAQN